jgi:hypothetical protein
MTGDWRIWRPAIWLAMLGIAVVLLVDPPYIGAIPLGAAIGVAIRIEQRRRRAASAAAAAAAAAAPAPAPAKRGGMRRR